MMDRRSFLCGLTLGTLAAPLTAEAQQAGKAWRGGVLGRGLETSVVSPGHAGVRTPRRRSPLNWVSRFHF